jgi:hypothetical protein
MKGRGNSKRSSSCPPPPSPSPIEGGGKGQKHDILHHFRYCDIGTWGEGNKRRIDHGFGDSFLRFLMIFGMKKEKIKRPTEKKTLKESN